MNNELYHFGILGMHWGIRRYQNKDGTLTPAGQKRDQKWAQKKSEKITTKAKKSSQKELNAYQKELLKNANSVNKDGRLSAQTVNAYNKRMSEIMSSKVSNLKSPSGRSVSFVAKRGEIGVFMVLSNTGFNANQFKNGIYDSGRVAYKKTSVNKMDID